MSMKKYMRESIVFKILFTGAKMFKDHCTGSPFFQFKSSFKYYYRVKEQQSRRTSGKESL